MAIKSFIFLLNVGLKTKDGTLPMLSTHCTTELYPQVEQIFNKGSFYSRYCNRL